MAHDHTQNHVYNCPVKGLNDWHVPLNENWRKIDTDVEVRDVDASKNEYIAKEGAVFRATDTGDVYLGDGASWNRINPPTGVTHVRSGDSLVDAIVEGGEGSTYRLHSDYDVSVESLPVEVTVDGITITGSRSGAGREATVVNDTGRPFLRLDQGNKRAPGVRVQNLNIVQSSGGNGIQVHDSKFNLFAKVDVDMNGQGTGKDGDAWYFGNATDSFGNNTQILESCTAEQAGRYGFQFGNLCHHVKMFGCKASESGRVGVYVNGPCSFGFIGGQLEDNRGPGLRARVADSVLVGGNTYIEGNAIGSNPIADAEVAFDRSNNCWVQGPIWANSNGAKYVVEFKDTSAPHTSGGRISGVRTVGYDKLARIDGMADVDLMGSTHVTSAPMADISPRTARVRNHGTVVGAGEDNGGNGDLGGVNLAEVDGQFSADEAMSDGTNTRHGLSARWLARKSAWQPSDGGPTI